LAGAQIEIGGFHAMAQPERLDVDLFVPRRERAHTVQALHRGVPRAASLQ